MITVTVDTRRLGRLHAMFRPWVDRRIREAAEATRDGAKARSRVRTGQMRAGWQTEGSDADYRTFNEVPWTVYNEYGTRSMTAQPMLHPAVDEEVARLNSRFRDLVAEIG